MVQASYFEDSGSYLASVALAEAGRKVYAAASSSSTGQASTLDVPLAAEVLTNVTAAHANDVVIEHFSRHTIIRHVHSLSGMDLGIIACLLAVLLSFCAILCCQMSRFRRREVRDEMMGKELDPAPSLTVSLHPPTPRLP